MASKKDGKKDVMFNELFDTFLSDAPLNECLRKAEWFSGSLENLPTQLYSNASRKRRLIAVKSEPEDPEDYKVDTMPDMREAKLTPEEMSLLKSDESCLTKGEEKALKRVRRKIKNKISAQESRRKKKEYVEGLERRVNVFSSVNENLKQRLTELEVINKALQDKIISVIKKKNVSSIAIQTDAVNGKSEVQSGVQSEVAMES